MNCNTSVTDSFNRSIFLRFDSEISRYGGLVAMVHMLRKSGFLEEMISRLLASFPPDRRNPLRIEHSRRKMLLQRFLGLLAGREDLNDSTDLQNDPGFIAALGNVSLASAPTLCRLERDIPQAVMDGGNAFLLDMYLKYAPRRKYIFIDIDNTPVELFGQQEGIKFNGHYGCNCYLPLLAFIDGFPVGVYNDTEDGRKTAVLHFGDIVSTIRAHNPGAVIVLRADSGFNSTELIDLCEKELGCFYLMGLSPNKVLMARLEHWAPEFVEVLHRAPEKGGSVLRHLGEIDDYQAQSWSGPRRIIARDYWNDERRQWDARFIQTNIPRAKEPKADACGRLAQYSAQQLYDLLYCDRGNDERFNQEFKVQAYGARTSSTLFLTNSYRMLLGACCQLAYRLFRIFSFKKGNSWRDATIEKVRRTFVCCPAIFRGTVRKLEVTLPRSLDALMPCIKRIWWGYQP